MVLSLDLVDVVKTLSLNQTVEEGTSETSDDFLGFCVVVGVTFFGDVVLVGLRGLEEIW